jgi:predicted small secreted protein
MKRLTINIISIAAIFALLITGCDNSSIVKDNAPPSG